MIFIRFVLSSIIAIILIKAIVFQVHEAKLHTLNHFMPSTYSGLQDPQKVSRYLHYYWLISILTPMKADALAMQGYCYSILGQWPKAQTAYESAVRLKPDSFWPVYNLAVTYARQGQGAKARQALQQAGTITPQQAMEHMMSSKVYTSIMNEYSVNPQILAQHLMQGYRDVQLWLSVGEINPSAELSVL